MAIYQAKVMLYWKIGTYQESNEEKDQNVAYEVECTMHFEPFVIVFERILFLL